MNCSVWSEVKNKQLINGFIILINLQILNLSRFMITLHHYIINWFVYHALIWIWSIASGTPGNWHMIPVILPLIFLDFHIIDKKLVFQGLIENLRGFFWKYDSFRFDCDIAFFFLLVSASLSFFSFFSQVIPLSFIVNQAFSVVEYDSLNIVSISIGFDFIWLKVAAVKCWRVAG